MESFPAYFPLAGARVVIAGAGEPAEARARLLAGSPAEIVRLDQAWGLDPDAYQGARLIFIASHDDEFARRAEIAARTAGAPVNVFDRPELSDFNTPAIIDRGRVVVAVGTSGAAPLVAQMLRGDIETRLPDHLEESVGLLGGRRDQIRRALPDLAERRAFLRAFLATPGRTGADLDAALAAPRALAARIALIDLPAADDLISLRAIRALGSAEAVAAPAEGEGLLARHARRDATRLAFEGLTATPLIERVGAGHGVAIIAPGADLVASLAGAPVTHFRAAPEAA